MIQLVRISTAGNITSLPISIISKPKSETSRYFPPPFPFLDPNRLFPSWVLAPEWLPTEEWREIDAGGVVGKWWPCSSTLPKDPALIAFRRPLWVSNISERAQSKGRWRIPLCSVDVIFPIKVSISFHWYTRVSYVQSFLLQPIRELNVSHTSKSCHGKQAKWGLTLFLLC
jgi:hypothetical protein